LQHLAVDSSQRLTPRSFVAAVVNHVAQGARVYLPPTPNGCSATGVLAPGLDHHHQQQLCLMSVWIRSAKFSQRGLWARFSFLDTTTIFSSGGRFFCSLSLLEYKHKRRNTRNEN
jgi:hypothetical protein